MIKSLKELGIPDYSWDEWHALSHRTMFSESLVIYGNNEDMSSPPRNHDVWIERIRMLAFPKTYSHNVLVRSSIDGSPQSKKVEFTESPVAFKLYNGWDDDLLNASSNDIFFSILENIDASYIPVLNSGSGLPFNPYSLLGNFPDLIYNPQSISEIICSIRDTINRIGGSDACTNHKMNYYPQFPERLKSLLLLEELVSKNPFTSKPYNGWEGDRAVYPYYISIKREHGKERARWLY